ncbi:protein of unknown function (plasmid) [Cupriavidus taiwanensis]|nr:protein of unknown function [Cupriavidus taiwanensis]
MTHAPIRVCLHLLKCVYILSFAQARATRAKAVIPPRSNRRTKHRYSRDLYRTRNLVERIFNFRRVSTRYDKLADSYLVFASLACAFGPVVNVNRP